MQNRKVNEPAAKRLTTETDFTDGRAGLRITDLEHEITDSGIGYNRSGDKVEPWDDDERPGETFEMILRRNDGAIEKAKDEFFAKVWYRRKFDMLHNRAHALEPFLPKDQLDALQNTMKNVERICEKKNLGPWNDFEWGMINGKLLALRWVLGEEWDALDWDMLDTAN